MPVRIPLFKAKALGFERDMVTFSVKGKSIPFLIATAVIDTGCPYTILSESALKRTTRSYNNRETECVVNIGPIPVELKKLDVCQLSFNDDAKNPVFFEQNVYVGLPKIKGYLAQELPSFIGKDFLDGHLLSIVNRKEGSFILKDE